MTLVAADGSVFIVDRKAALVSGTIKSMLAGPGARLPLAAHCHPGSPPRASSGRSALQPLPPGTRSDAHGATCAPATRLLLRMTSRVPLSRTRRRVPGGTEQRDQVPRNLGTHPRKGDPVLLLQAQAHQLCRAPSRVQDRARARPRAAHGRELSRRMSHSGPCRILAKRPSALPGAHTKLRPYDEPSARSVRARERVAPSAHEDADSTPDTAKTGTHLHSEPRTGFVSFFRVPRYFRLSGPRTGS